MNAFRIICVVTVTLLIVLKDNAEGGVYCSNRRHKPPLYGVMSYYIDGTPGTLPPIADRAPKDCKPIYINMIVRHGARYPPPSLLPVLDELLVLARNLNTTGKARICGADLQALRNWKIFMNKYDVYNQTAIGDREIEVIAERYQAEFPEILSCSHNPDRYRFVSTNTPRTAQSMDRFAEKILCSKKGKLPPGASLSVTPTPIDPFRRGNCAKFEKGVRTNSSVYTENRLFLQGPQFRRLRNRIRLRLGISPENVTPELLVKIYQVCFYERWVTPNYSPWCRIFGTKDLEVLEYAQDLKGYQFRSYAHSVNYERQCHHSKEIVNTIKLASEFDQKGEKYLLGLFRSGHTSNTITLAANFGLFKVKTPPTAKNFNQQKNRLFKTRVLSPSGGHLTFVLYRCGNVTSSCYDVNNYKVQIYMNEHLMSIPACAQPKSNDKNTESPKDSETLCDLGKFLEYYERFVAGSESECNQAEICRL